MYRRAHQVKTKQSDEIVYALYLTLASSATEVYDKNHFYLKQLIIINQFSDFCNMYLSLDLALERLFTDQHF